MTYPREQALAELAALLGSSGFLQGADMPERNRGDLSSALRQTPLALLRPASTGEVSAVMAICHAAGLAVVPQGGLTGLSGGATPGPDQIALSLERMTAIGQIDTANACVTVEAGAVLEPVQQAARRQGFEFAVDIGSRGSCTIGGMISTNAGGYRVVRHGMMRQQVLGIEAVLPDGTIVGSLGRLRKDNAGFDLKHSFIGAEGCLGVVTRAVLALQPAPAETVAALIGVADFGAALACLDSARQGLAADLSAFEVFWPEYWELMTRLLPHRQNPLSCAPGLYLLVEAQGGRGAADRFSAWLEQLADEGLIEDAAVALTSSQIDRLWAFREASDEFWPLATKDPHLGFDIGLLPSDTGRFVELCRKGFAEIADIIALYFGHLGDGNLHVSATVPGGKAEIAERVEHIVYEAMRTLVGTVTAEHGVGVLKRRWLALTRSPEELALMRRLKLAFDAKGLMNPGKVLPEE